MKFKFPDKIYVCILDISVVLNTNAKVAIKSTNIGSTIAITKNSLSAHNHPKYVALSIAYNIIKNVANAHR